MLIFMVWPVPTTVRTTPDVPAMSHCPFTCFTSSMWTCSGVPRLKTMALSFENDSNLGSSSKGNA